MLLSIVIPVYNVEEYLRECLNSVLGQEFKDYEAILVDDGSTDKSGAVCDEYAGKHPAFKVIHQENQGLSAARNAGMDAAGGVYILFLDSDDMLREGCLEELSPILRRENCDMVCGRHRYFREGMQEEPPDFRIPAGSYSREEWLKQADQVQFGDLCATYFLYRREFLEEKRLSFTRELLHEDELWTPFALLSADSVCQTDILFYLQREREGSITHSGNYEKKAESLFYICRELDRLYSESPDRVPAFLKNRLCLLFLRGVRFSDEQDWESFGRVFPLRYAGDLRQRSKALLYFLSPGLYRRIAVRLRES